MTSRRQFISLLGGATATWPLTARGKIDLRWAEGRDDRSVEIAADFVRLKVDGIVKYSDVQARIAKQATSTIPIVATLLKNPVGSGLVASFASVYRLATTRQHRCAGNCEILVRRVNGAAGA